MLPPYEVVRVLDFIHGKRIRRITKSMESRSAPGLRDRLRDLIAGRDAAGPSRQPRVIEEKRGLGKGLPRSMRTEIERYIRERETDPEWFDECVLQARKAMKRMYALLHIRPSERAQMILFDENPPKGSKLHALKQIGRAKSPAEQARVIAEQRIPYRVATSVIKKMTPSVLAALIDVMTPQEVINNMGSLRRRGVFDNDDLKDLVEQKLAAAQKDGRVSAYKAKKAVEKAGVSKDLAGKLDRVTETKLKAKGEIKRPTALLVDKSGSMDIAIDVAKQIGALISSLCTADLFVYAFDTSAYPIKVAGDVLSDWEKAFRGIQAAGGTSCGVALEWMRKKRQYVEQILMVTDEEENQHPFFIQTLERYSYDLKTQPNVCIVKIGRGSNQIQKGCQQAAIPCDVFRFEGDYYALPNLVPLLSKPSRVELLMEIMEYPLPKRKPR
ncbi:MAG: VWA domain-containing protein [Deltaproteobacteria bacterium]|nr:MAG: VWA domain-containing protein [Deltaproteobacteria bacterium]